MKKQILFLLSLAYCALANAAVITPSEALERANVDQLQPMFAGAQPYRLVHAVADAQNQPAVYIFNRGGESFGQSLILAADDLVEPVLGYADCGGDMPADFVWWLDEYARQIEYLRQHPSLAAKNDAAKARPSRDPINPLITTTWDQGSPYNNLCPRVNGQLCYTGCMATDMAQIMKYFNWPPRGTGEITYDCLNINQMLSMDFSSITFDWDNMLDTYENGSNANQRHAVAELMKACGYAQQMAYGTNSSGAVMPNYISAMIDYFDYDPAMRYCERNQYSLYDWEEMIYENLVNVGPVHMGAGNLSGGHAFICDGYDTDGFFHINWGWNGHYNGYFLLSVLEPAGVGSGAWDGSGFIFNQDILLNIHPNRHEEFEPRAGINEFYVNDATAREWVNLYGFVYSLTPVDTDFEFGIIATSVDDGKKYFRGDCVVEGLPMWYGFGQWYSYLPEVPDGEYVITSAFRHDDKVYECIRNRDIDNIIHAKVLAGVYHFTTKDNNVDMPQIQNLIEPNVSAINRDPATIIVEFASENGFTGKVALETYDPEGNFVERIEDVIYIPANDSRVFNYSINPTSDKYHPGMYTFMLGVMSENKFVPITPTYYQLDLASKKSVQTYGQLEDFGLYFDTNELRTFEATIKALQTGMSGDNIFDACLYMVVSKVTDNGVEYVGECVREATVGPWQNFDVLFEYTIPNPQVGNVYLVQVYQDSGADSRSLLSKQQYYVYIIEGTKWATLTLDKIEYNEEISEDNPTIRMALTITADGGYYDSSIRFEINKRINYISKGLYTQEIALKLNPYETKTIVLEWDAPDTEPGVSYLISVSQYLDSGYTRSLTNGETFIVNAVTSGINDVVADTDGDVRIYNLQGLEVDASSLTPGIYIRICNSKVEKIVVN